MIDIADKLLGIESWLSYEDPRYPILVLRSDEFGTIGYNLDIHSGGLTRVCICAAHSINECVCGAWDDSQNY